MTSQQQEYAVEELNIILPYTHVQGVNWTGLSFCRHRCCCPPPYLRMWVSLRVAIAVKLLKIMK